MRAVGLRRFDPRKGLAAIPRLTPRHEGPNQLPYGANPRKSPLAARKRTGSVANHHRRIIAIDVSVTVISTVRPHTAAFIEVVKLALLRAFRGMAGWQSGQDVFVQKPVP